LLQKGIRALAVLSSSGSPSASSLIRVNLFQAKLLKEPWLGERPSILRYLHSLALLWGIQYPTSGVLSASHELALIGSHAAGAERAGLGSISRFHVSYRKVHPNQLVARHRFKSTCVPLGQLIIIQIPSVPQSFFFMFLRSSRMAPIPSIASSLAILVVSFCIIYLLQFII